MILCPSDPTPHTFCSAKEPRVTKEKKMLNRRPTTTFIVSSLIFFVPLLKIDTIQCTAVENKNDDEEMRKRVFQGETF